MARCRWGSIFVTYCFSRRLSENSICALKPGEISKVYGRKTLAIPPILSIQMLFLDSLLAAILGQGPAIGHGSPGIDSRRSRPRRSGVMGGLPPLRVPLAVDETRTVPISSRIRF